MKRILSLLLVNIMLLCCAFCAPFTVYAYEGEVEIVNDFYNSGDFSVYEGSKLRSEPWMSAAADKLRDAMALRERKCEIRLNISAQQALSFTDKLLDIFSEAVSAEKSCSTIDGDYIRWQVSNCMVNYKYLPSSKSYAAVYSIAYYDSQEEEIQLNEQIKNYLSSLDMDSMTDYEILKEFHDYIIERCEYNYEDMQNHYNYSAYGALCLGKAVCQGYALAFYRLCKEAGFDACFICSDPQEGCHAWNLVHIGNAYYFVDCTWDDELEGYDFFLVDYDTLRSMDFMGEHEIYDEVHNNSYFNNRYRKNISPVAYSTGSKSISNCIVSVNKDNCYDVSVSCNGTPLVYGQDYTVSTSQDCFSLVSGMGEYSGTYSSKCLSIYNKNTTISTDVVYNKSSTLPTAYVDGLVADRDYIVVGDSNHSKGSAFCAVTGKGAYTGVYYSGYNVLAADINTVPISLSYTSVYYDGMTKQPEVYVEGLDYNEDYLVSFNPPLEDGRGYVTVTGINNYTSSATLSYDVYKKNIADYNITLSETDFEYNGYEKRPTVYIQGLVEGQEYTVSYSDNINIGTASVIISGINLYTGTVVLNFTIHKKADTTVASAQTTAVKKPAKSKITKLKTSKKSVTVSWKKLTGIDGYQLQYSTSSSFKKPKSVNIKSKKTVSKKISSLKKGKKYYFRIRAYKTVNGKKLYGTWSAKKSITCK